ncbi:MAG: hypothetical protein GEU98_21100 [Pseudonocardiaceae bacterium]|nr:hypothetical protein [Pseudonocardiaceae bacterium]
MDTRASDLAEGALAAALAVLTMAGLAVLGVHLIGLDANIPLGYSAAAALALAVGGSVSLDGAAGPATRGGDGLPVQIGGDLGVMPLGVSVCGAVVFAGALLIPLRARPAPPSLAARAATALVTFHVCLLVAFLVWRPVGGTLSVAVDIPRTVLGGSVWTLIVLGLCALSHRVPVPARLAPARDASRAVVGVLLITVCLGMLVGVIAGTFGGARVLGTMLLGAPNLVVIALTRGLGVPWSAHTETSGLLEKLPPGRMPDLFSAGANVDPGALRPLEARLWPLALVAGVLLVLCAWRMPREGGRPVARAAWLAGALAVTFAGITELAGISVHLSAGVAGFDLFGLRLGISGNALLAAAYGAVGGFVASLLTGAARSWHCRHLESVAAQGHRS